MNIRRLGEQVGVEVTGVRGSRLDDAQFDEIYQAWLSANVLVVRDQSFDLEQFLAFGRRFGVVRPHPAKSTRHPERPEITVLGVGKFHPDGSLNRSVYARGGEGWHTDGAYDEEPFKATALYALAIPSIGGDTLFASMYAAYDALPARLRRRLEGRRAGFTYGGRSRRSNALLNPEDRDWQPVFHPLFRTHSETGRVALYFDPGKIVSIEGIADEEAGTLIDELIGHMLQADGQYRHAWRKGDFVIWDNRCSYHRAAADYPPEQDRIHWRVSIKER